MKGLQADFAYLRLATVLSTVFGVALPFAAAQSQEVAAEEGAETHLEEITVTARRVEENLMTVPVSVSALSSADLDDRNIKDMTDISLFEPSFRFVNQQGGGSPTNDRNGVAVDFRGLVEAGGSGSVFIDGAPVINGIYPSLDEIERVEVLKGPQSAYFGRSTFAGAINYVTKEPSLTTVTGSVRVEESTFSSTDDSLSLSVPVINDMLGVRVDARHFVKGGEYTNAADTNQMLGAQETNSVSTTILFKPNDKLSAKGWLSWTVDHDGPGAEGGLNASDGFFNIPSPAAATFQGGYVAGPIPNASRINPAVISCACTMTPFLRNILVNNTPGARLIFNPDWSDHFGLQRDTLQTDLKVDYEFLPGYTLSSLTAYHSTKSEDRWDIDNRAGNGPAPFAVANPDYPALPNTLPYYEFDLTSLIKQSDWSEEVRVTSPQDKAIKWSIGFDYLYSSSPGGSLFGEIPVGPANFGTISPNHTETPAVFGGVSYEFLPKFTLSLEARYQKDRLHTQTLYSGNVATTGISAQPLTGTFDSFSPRVSLDYAFMPNSTAYLLFSRGYKPGGFNTAVLLDTPAQLAYIAARGGNTSLTFAQERLDNYEVGFKSTFLDDRARVTVAFYYDKWSQGQVPAQIDVPANPLAPLGGGNTEHEEEPVSNAGVINLKGIEYTGDFQVTSHLAFNTSAAINATDVVFYQTCSDGLEILGTPACNGHVPLAPKYTASVAATYTDHLFGDWNWYGRVDYNYSGMKYVDYTNVAWIPAAQLVNLRFGVREQKLELEAFVTNLNNNTTPLSVDHQVNAFTFFTQNQNTIDYALPDKRAFGVRAHYSF